MGLREQRAQFEQTKQIYESVPLVFKGVEGFDVYNPSVPFTWKGKRLIYGRVERRTEWARSWVRLFEQTGQDEWTLVPDSMIYQLEDPYVSFHGNTLVLGGTHVRFTQGKIDTYYGYFYQGEDTSDLRYFTTGPDRMKDIRLVAMADGSIGVFSRPRGERVREIHGSESMIGFSVIPSLDALTHEVIAEAPYIPGIFGNDEWGGCNQAYLLDSGNIGVVAHMGYRTTDEEGQMQAVYLNAAFVVNPVALTASPVKIIGTRNCYPAGPSKKDYLKDCAFTAGIVPRPDGRVDLYSGTGDCGCGRIVIDDPFAGYGRITGF